MLKLKETIKLQTIRPTAVLSGLSLSPDGEPVDPFFQRLTENYSIIGTRFTPEELMFLVTAPPEAPEFGGGVTQIAFQENINQSRDFTLNVLNNVVNRVLYSETSRFTFQDEVYISSMLRKLGITDVALFMRQVTNLRRDTRNIHNLIQYYAETAQKSAPVPGGEEAGARNTEKPQAAGTIPETGGESYTIHNEIYRRLHTAENYAIVHNFNKDVSFSAFISAAELHTAEQWRVSNLLTLSEYTNQAPGVPAADLNHIHFNQYELGGILPPPQTEREVIRQSAAGVLLNIIDNIMTARVTQLTGNEVFWLDLRQAVYGAAERSLSRFQLFHTGQAETQRVIEQITRQEAARPGAALPESALREHAAKSAGEEAGIPDGEREISAPLKEQLDEYDRRNREAAERLIQRIQKLGPLAEPRADITQIMRDSIKSLENPAQMQDELYNTEAEMLHTQALSPEAEAVLAGADETTRIIYESLLRHRRGPEAEINEIHSQLNTFNAEIREVERHQTAEITHRTETLRESEETVRRHTETVLEHYRTVYGPRAAGTAGVFREAARTVHRVPERQTISEELVEQLTRRQNDERRETVNREISEHRTVTETQINNAVQEQTAKSAEEIAELVNSSIARQMNVISERVYNQMERRLSLERARRGK